MNTRFKILFSVAIMVIGVGIYANYPGAGNDEKVENATQSTSNAFEQLKPQLDSLTTGDMAAMRILEKPLDLTEISFDDDNGKKLTIADWKGRVVLLNLWATWCPPCRHEMPFLEDLEARLGGDNFQVVSVSIDLKSPDKPKAFYAEIGLEKLGFYWDGTAKIFNDLKKYNLAFGMPTTILIDENGMALGALNGPAVWNSPEAFALIEKVLKANTAS